MKPKKEKKLNFTIKVKGCSSTKKANGITHTTSTQSGHLLDATRSSLLYQTILGEGIVSGWNDILYMGKDNKESFIRVTDVNPLLG